MNTLHLSHREWFDRINGNSYFTCAIYVDGKKVTVLPFQYGYGEHYKDMASQWLNSNGYTSQCTPLWRYCEANKIAFTTESVQVLKRDLHKEQAA